MPLNLDDLSGYTVTALAADLDRWFADEERVDVGSDIRPVTDFLQLLPSADAAALAAFDTLVRSGRLAQFMDVYDWSYGFDFAANDCAVHGAEHVWALAADGSSNLYVVLPDGSIRIWFHEEETLEEGTGFDNLDVFLWTMVRYRATLDGSLELAEVEDDLRALGQPGVLHAELGLLASLT
ncbi:hypothetical protein [Actinoplanes sp. NPDC051851]|uniref:hypothetical protein n=1 Tax=Actinoplanes sp. NPDC051851 TaxID=3154753 RepID=UPI003426066A